MQYDSKNINGVKVQVLCLVAQDLHCDKSPHCTTEEREREKRALGNAPKPTPGTCLVNAVNYQRDK